MYVSLNNLLVGIVSLCFGSFIAAASYRVIRNESFLKGRSHCDNCKKNLPWFVNIPILSYVFLLGKCFYCKKDISFRYPLIESSNLIGSVLVFNYLGLVYVPVFWILLFIFVCDVEDMIIPDTAVFILFFYSLLFVNNSYVFSSLFSGFFASLLFLLLNLFTKGKGLGLGDVKLAIPLGFMLGLTSLYQFITLSFVIGGIFAVFLLILNKAKMKTRVAFGPFMILSFLITLIYPNLFI